MDGGDEAAGKGRGTVKKGIDVDKARKRRENHVVKIRKEKLQEQYAKRRFLGDDDEGQAVAVEGGIEGWGAAAPAPGPVPMAAPTSMTQQITSMGVVGMPDLATFAAKLLSNRVEDAEEGAIGIRKALSVDHNPPIDEVIRIPGVVRRLVDFLRRDDVPKLQFECAWALTNISSGTQRHTSTVIEHGALPEFVRLLGSTAVQVQEQAVWALGNIAGDSADLRDRVLAAHALPALLASIIPTAPLSFIRNATWTLSNLCRGKPPPAPEAVKMILPKLAQLIHSTDKDVLTDALWALSYVSDDSDKSNFRVQAVVESGCVRQVVALLRHAHVSIVTPALRTIGNIVTGEDSQTQAALNAGALQPLIQLMGHDKRGIRREATWAVSNIMAGSATQVQECIDRGALPILIKLIGEPTYDVAKEACWAICNACTVGTPQHVDRIFRQPNAVAMLLRSASMQDERLVLVALEGLQKILDVGTEVARGRPNPYYDLFEELEAPGLLLQINRGRMEHAADLAEKILEKHFKMHLDGHLGDEEEEGEEEEGEETEGAGYSGFGGGAPTAPSTFAFPAPAAGPPPSYAMGLPQQQAGFGGAPWGQPGPGAPPSAAPPAAWPAAAPGGPAPAPAPYSFQAWAPGNA